MKSVLMCMFLLIPTFASALTINLPYFEQMNSCALSLEDPRDVVKWRRELFRAARKKISISYYAFDEDYQAYEFLALLTEAAERGVKVEIIFDNWTSIISKETLAYLEQKNVSVKFYNPPRRLRNIIRVNNRKHDKYIVFDDDFIMLGGRNLKNGYLNRSAEYDHSYFDMDAIFRGAPAKDALTYFEGRWSARWVEKALRWALKDEALISAIEAKVEDARESLNQNYPDPRSALNLSNEELLNQLSTDLKNAIIQTECSHAQFYSPDPSRVSGENLEAAYAKFIDESSSNIDIVNPYVILTKKIKRSLINAVKRGVKVRIYTNSLQSNDEPLAQAAYLNDRKSLIRSGLEIYEFFDEIWTLHSKVALFDNQVSLIGSFNLDPRSARLNSEVFMTSSDPESIHSIKNHIEATSVFTKKIGRNGLPENSPYKHPNTTYRQRIRNGFLQLVAPLIRQFL